MGMPQTLPDLEVAKTRARKSIAKFTAVSTGGSIIPIPGADLVTDLYSSMKMLNEINEIYGLSSQQIDKLDPAFKVMVAEAIVAAGGQAIGRLITKELIVTLLAKMGKRVTAKQLTKYVPIIGQLASAAISVTVMASLGEKHRRDCQKVCQIVMN